MFYFITGGKIIYYYQRTFGSTASNFRWGGHLHHRSARSGLICQKVSISFHFFLGLLFLALHLARQPFIIPTLLMHYLCFITFLSSDSEGNLTLLFYLCTHSGSTKDQSHWSSLSYLQICPWPCPNLSTSFVYWGNNKVRALIAFRFFNFFISDRKSEVSILYSGVLHCTAFFCAKLGIWPEI